MDKRLIEDLKPEARARVKAAVEALGEYPSCYEIAAVAQEVALLRDVHASGFEPASIYTIELYDGASVDALHLTSGARSMLRGVAYLRRYAPPSDVPALITRAMAHRQSPEVVEALKAWWIATPWEGLDHRDVDSVSKLFGFPASDRRSAQLVEGGGQ